MAPRITTTGEFEQRAFEFCAPQQLFRSTIVVGRLYQPRMLSGLTEWSRREPTTSTGSSLKGASGNERVKRPTDLIDHPLFNAGVGIDSAISQEWPVGPMLVDASPINVGCYNLFLIDRTFCDDFAVRSAHETLPPKFDAISTGGRFVTDAVRHRDVAPVGDRMTTLNRLPRGMLRLSKFLFLARMPADCRWIKNNLRAVQGSQPRCLRIPLVPAHADTNFAPCCVPRLEPKIARREVKFFV